MLDKYMDHPKIMKNVEKDETIYEAVLMSWNDSR
jgi:hypothetical protein